MVESKKWDNRKGYPWAGIFDKHTKLNLAAFVLYSAEQGMSIWKCSRSPLGCKNQDALFLPNLKFVAVQSKKL